MYNFDEMKEKFEWAVEILENNMDGFDNEERETYIDDVVKHGCISGCVSGVISYTETKKLFTDNMDEILDYLQDMKEEHGINLFKNVNIETLYNEAVWMVIEETAHAMLNYITEEQY